MPAGLLLALALAAVGWFARRTPSPPSRAARYRRWMARVGAAFGLSTLAGLALLGRVDALWRLPMEFAPLRAMLPAMALAEVAGGAIGGVAIGLAVAGWRARRGGRPIGKPGSLMPRSRAELPWGAAVALVAGVAEELFFRLLLPLLIAIFTGSALLGFGAATLVFAGLHRYQGWRGVVATGLFGAVMTAILLISGALWLVVLLHAAIDLGGLVLWPALYRAR
ncbi:CPBP family intramembrane glutamic endopeptidase [Sphingomonas rubra]|uniref:CAAX protease self-immunity n=1 Tax=Sphingomonas rubra TaxID=634430 RepID=A0A1I5ST86_9SPHN|nr:CPBP family intramembrane glutamic endopeptidase [Sphingomonas rubra]SFP74024.1 CAAX protease self-immunity [Sphingomonas rubra]